MCGLTGLKIIEAICKGNLNPAELAKHRHFNCRKSEQEIAKALKGNNRPDYLFGPRQEFETYQFLQNKIAECEVQISRFLQQQINADPEKKKLQTTDKKHKRINKNAITGIDLN